MPHRMRKPNILMACIVFSDGNPERLLPISVKKERVRIAPRIRRAKQTKVKYLEQVFAVQQWHQTLEAKELMSKTLPEDLDSFTALPPNLVMLAAVRF